MRMTKTILAFLLFSPLLAAAQLTTVSGTVTDPNGFKYKNGTITATLVISNTPKFISNGVNYQPPSGPSAIDNNGKFVMTLADVNALTPSGGTWSFHVCSAQGTIQPGSPITGGPVCFDLTGVVITGTSMDIGAQLSAVAAPLTSPELENQGGVTSINGQKGAFTFSGAGVTCGGLLCTFGGAAGAGTVGTGIAGQYAIYNAPNTVVGTPNLVESVGTIRAAIPLVITNTGTPSFQITNSGIGNALIRLFDGGTGSVSFTINAGSPYTTLNIGGLVNVPILQANNIIPVSQSTLTPVAATNELAANSAGVLSYSLNGGAFDFIRPIDFNGTPTSGTVAGPLNFNSTTPAAPTNGRNISFAVSGTSVSAALVGDGSTNCLSGQGTYVPCSGGAGAGVTSINTVTGAFSFVGSGVSCASTTCTFTGTGTGIGGSGTAPNLAVFTGPSSLGNAPITATSSTVNFGTPSPLAPTSTATLTAGLKAAVNQSTGTCANGNQIPLNPTSSVGCAGMDLLYNSNNSTSSGTNAGLIVRGNGASSSGTGVLGMGIAAIETSSSNMTEQRAGYFEADSGQFTGVITTSRGLFAVAVNSSGAVTNNEGIVAQSGVIGSGTNTNDFSIHCLPALTGGVMTTHACVKIEPQGPGNGVEFQTGPHVFANLPTCTAAYEGSLASITDSTVTGGTISGGGSSHVLAYCNGSAWIVGGAGGGSGGTGATLAQVCAVPSTQTWATNTGNLNWCVFSIPAVAHTYILRCVAQMDVTQGAGQTTDLDIGVNLTTAPATATKFMATYRDPGANAIFLYSNLFNAATGSQNLVIHSVTNSVTSVAETFDGVLNLPGTAQTMNVYVGTSLAGIGGNLLAGSYCMLD